MLFRSQQIAERQQAEEALRDSEKKFSTMFEASPIGISIATFPKGEMQDVNEAWMHITGYSKKEDALGILRDTFLNGLLQIYAPQEMSTSL